MASNDPIARFTDLFWFKHLPANQKPPLEKSLKAWLIQERDQAFLEGVESVKFQLDKIREKARTEGIEQGQKDLDDVYFKTFAESIRAEERNRILQIVEEMQTKQAHLIRPVAQTLEELLKRIK